MSKVYAIVGFCFAVIVFACFPANANAGCWCERFGIPEYCLDYWLGFPGYEIPGSRSTTTVLGPKYVSDGPQYNYQCRFEGEVPPKKSCVITASQITDQKYKISGNLEFGDFGVNGSYDDTTTIAVSCGGEPQRIEDFCQCCYAVAFRSYESVTVSYRCQCSFFGVPCSNGEVVSGTLETLTAIACNPDGFGCEPPCVKKCPTE
jgi:hypothetical protein